MNISGVLVHSRPEKTEIVEAALEDLPGVEVHQITDDGLIIVTVEDTDAVASGDTMVKMNLLEGVLSASLVYHHFEPDAPDARSDAITTS